MQDWTLYNSLPVFREHLRVRLYARALARNPDLTEQEFNEAFAELSTTAIRKVVYGALMRILKIIKGRKGRVCFQDCAIQHIYYQPTPEDEEKAMLAESDLDETRGLSHRQSININTRNRVNKILKKKKLGWRANRI